MIVTFAERCPPNIVLLFKAHLPMHAITVLKSYKSQLPREHDWTLFCLVIELMSHRTTMSTKHGRIMPYSFWHIKEWLMHTKIKLLYRNMAKKVYNITKLVCYVGRKVKISSSSRLSATTTWKLWLTEQIKTVSVRKYAVYLFSLHHTNINLTRKSCFRHGASLN